MADQFTQTTNGTGTTTVALTLNGVVAGSALVAFLFNGSHGAGVTFAVADGQGSYTSKTSIVGPDGNSVSGQGFVLENANSGSHTITGTTNSGDSAFMLVAEIGSSGAGATTGGNGASQNAPGIGADAISSGSVTASGSCTLVAISTDSAVVNVIDEPAAGTGFTSRDSNANGTIGSWRAESKAIGASAAGTFTAILGLDQYITLAISITNSGGAAAIVGSYYNRLVQGRG